MFVLQCIVQPNAIQQHYDRVAMRTIGMKCVLQHNSGKCNNNVALVSQTQHFERVAIGNT